MAEAQEAFANQIVEALEARDMSNHPFLQYFGTEMTEDELRKFAIQWSKMTQRTGGLASILMANIAINFWDEPNLEMRRSLADEIVDEETGIKCGSMSHCELAIRFAESVVVGKAELFATPPLPETVEYTNWAIKVCRDHHYLYGLGTMGGGEYLNPPIMRAIVSGLRDRFDKNNNDIEFFIVHIEGDEEHGDLAVRALAEYAGDDEQKQKEALEELIIGADLFRGVLDGLYRIIVGGEEITHVSGVAA